MSSKHDEKQVYEPGQPPQWMTPAKDDEKQVYEPGGGIRPVARMVGPWLQKQTALPGAGRGPWTLSAGDVELRYATEEHCLLAAKEIARRSGEQWIAQLYPEKQLMLMQPYEADIDRALLSTAMHTYLIGA